MDRDQKILLALAAAFLAAGAGVTALVRSHGIESCRDRGGTPIVRSWASRDPWDVSCIRTQP